ncbi:hypothetical protein V5O48_001637 [Marasmius crinis-equi]|uniref:Uncharacterized protein n=1 Tax=Marasmius crinis-equi TaxID=585013 RepID=A0ABR3FZ35_9AGAR
MAHQPLPLHPVAPVPIPCHAPSFLAGDVAVSLGGPDLENRYQDYPQMINTFPTPSELLFEVQSNEATSPISDTSGDSSSLSTPPKLQSFAREVQPAELSTLMVHSGRDGISSHEKKRQLLECLEHYVLHLHEQLTMIGAEPVPLERVADYRGLSSRSIRTLLVHMENKNKELNSTIVAEEERVSSFALIHSEGGLWQLIHSYLKNQFLRLREALYRRDVPTNMALQEHPESQINGTVPYV